MLIYSQYLLEASCE